MPNTIEATITQKNGLVYVERNGERLSLEIGDSIYEQDLIVTGSNTVAEIQYRDGTKSRLAPDTEMRLVDFEYGKTADSENSFLVDMHHGSIRTVTGDIVKLNPNGFVITADDVVVNVLGSDTLISVSDSQVYVGSAFTSVGVQVHVQNADPHMLQALQSLTFSPSSDVPLLQMYGSPVAMQNAFKTISFPLAWAVPISVQEEQENMEQSPIAEDTITTEDSSDSTDDQTQIFPLGVHSAQQNIILMQTGLSEQVLISPSFNLSGLQMAPIPDIVSGQFANPSLIYPGTNPSISNNETIEGPDTFYQIFDEGDSPLSMTEGDDWVQIAHMKGGIVNLLGGNDLIEVSAMGADASQIKPVVFSRTSLTPEDFGPNDLQKPAIFGGDGNDTISIGEMTEGSIYAGEGNDVVSISKPSGFDFINLEGGDDVLSVFVESSSVSLTKITGGEGTDVIITNQTGLVPDSDLEIVITHTNATSADDLKLENFNLQMHDNGSISLGHGWSVVGSGSYVHASGVTMDVYVSSPYSAEPMTMSMNESSFAIPVIQDSDPAQDAYDTTINHYTAVI